MSALRRVIAAFRNLVRRDGRDRDLDAELESYLELSADEHEVAGRLPTDARRLAKAELGSVAATAEAVRQGRAGAGVDRVWQDVRYALRSLRRAPGFASAAILILSLGIGANTVIFSVADAALFKPLPYRDATQLVDVMYVFDAGTPKESGYVGLSWGQIDFWREQRSIFSEVLAYRSPRPATVADAITSAPTLVGRITPGLIDSLGIRAVRGRTFGPGDLSQPVALVSETFWTRSLDADPAVLGRTLSIDRQPYAIIGVMPATFSANVGGPTTVAWLPLDEHAERALPGGGRASTMLRMRPGLSVVEAQRLANAALAARGPEAPAGDARVIGATGAPSVRLQPADARQRSASDARSSLRILLAVVGVVLLIACANVANLLLGRALARRRELAMRAALGATRGRLLRQMLTEGFVLASLGGVGAIVLAAVAAVEVPRFVPWQLGLFYASPMVLDGRVLGVCAAAVVLTATLCSLLPALRASRANVLEALEGSARITGATPVARRSRQALQAVEVALTLVLLTGTSLLATSFLRMVTLSYGYDVDGLVSAGVSLSDSRYPGSAAQAAFDQLRQTVRANPAVRSASYGNVPPSGFGSRLALEGHEQDPPGTGPTWTLLYVDPDYFTVLGVPVKAGRTFSSADVAGSDLVTIIDAVTAERYWPGQSPLGKHIRFGPDTQPWSSIVGVVGAVKTRWFTSPSGTAQLYRPYAQSSMPTTRSLVVRARGDRASTVAAMRSAVQALDPQLEVKPLVVAEMYDDILMTPQFYLVLTSVFAAVALVTAAIGLFALLSYTVAQRKREIGVRLALGADVARIRLLVVRDALTPVASGIAVGLLASFWLSQFLASQLFGITPHDPASYAAAAALMIAVAGIAAYLPACRATRIDPIETLRE